MKKLLVFVIIIVAVVFLLYSNRPKTNQNITSKISESIEDAKDSVSPKEGYVFVPYWTIDSDISNTPSDNLIYFGVSVNKDGVNEDDPGYKNISDFVENSGNKNTYLTVRMLDSDINLQVLKDSKLQKEIIDESINIAKENGFKGIILDLEIQGIPFESFVKSITVLHEKYAKKSHAGGITFGTLLYGDTYFRARPYDVGKLAKIADRVYVMAYDFSKARSNPGPNFPLTHQDKYGYDFKVMTSDYLKDVPASKLTIVLGLFGYDWKVDDKERGLELALSKSTLGFEKFMTECVDSNTCLVSVDPESKETRIDYTEDREDHVIWFETSNSADKKIEYLKSQEINSIGYWAYTYY